MARAMAPYSVLGSAPMLVAFLGLGLCALRAASASTVHVFGGVRGRKASTATAVNNTRLLNASLRALGRGDTLVIPNHTYTVMGGVYVEGLTDATVQLDGTLEFSTDTKAWPIAKGKMPQTCLRFVDSVNLTITSSGMGTLDGMGSTWWGIPGVGYLTRGKNRPPLIEVRNATDFVFEHILLLNSPRFNFVSSGLRNAVIRDAHVSARRTSADSHTAIDLTAFNTDGFDLSGTDIHVHDCSVWNQDDTFCIKAKGEDTRNVLIENVRASGVGLSIGSIGNQNVKNVTFRNVNMHHTDKGIYLKFRDSASKGGVIEDVLYENIFIDKPSSWPIWIGPAQQDIKGSGTGPYNPCHGDPCSLCWPTIKSANCASPAGIFRNITLRNVTIHKPKTSAGVIFGNSSKSIEGLVFDGVRVIDPVEDGAWGKENFYCEGVSKAVATGGTTPVPPCFS